MERDDHPMPSLKELEILVSERRRLLEEAEAVLLAAQKRQPVPGDFVRSTLTNFYGRVTRVISRPNARPWVEITPYLTPTLRGRSTMDLYSTWEFIDGPAEGELGSTGLERLAGMIETIVAFEDGLQLVSPRQFGSASPIKISGWGDALDCREDTDLRRLR
jgi:hypothetical protein